MLVRDKLDGEYYAMKAFGCGANDKPRMDACKELASTKIIDRETGEVFRGHVPPYSVVVPGTTPSVDGKPGLYCAVIVKRVDAQTRSKTSINDLLRD